MMERGEIQIINIYSSTDLCIWFAQKVLSSVLNEFFRVFYCTSPETLMAGQLLGFLLEICKSAFRKLMGNMLPHCFRS